MNLRTARVIYCQVPTYVSGYLSRGWRVRRSAWLKMFKSNRIGVVLSPQKSWRVGYEYFAFCLILNTLCSCSCLINVKCRGFSPWNFLATALLSAYWELNSSLGLHRLFISRADLATNVNKRQRKSDTIRIYRIDTYIHQLVGSREHKYIHCQLHWIAGYLNW